MPWPAAHQASLSFIVSWSLFKLMPIESMMPSNHLVLCCPLLLLPSVFPSIKVFSNESALHIRWPKELELQLQHQSFQLIVQDWFTLGLTGLSSLQSKGLSRIFSNATVQKHQFLTAQPCLWSNSHIHTWLIEKPYLWLDGSLLAKSSLCFFFFPFIFISWRLIILQYCSGFCHTLTWISHGFTCAPHPDPSSHLPLHPIPLGHPSAPALITCLMHPTWAGDLFHPW